MKMFLLFETAFTFSPGWASIMPVLLYIERGFE